MLISLGASAVHAVPPLSAHVPGDFPNAPSGDIALSEPQQPPGSLHCCYSLRVHERLQVAAVLAEEKRAPMELEKLSWPSNPPEEYQRYAPKPSQFVVQHCGNTTFLGIHQCLLLALALRHYRAFVHLQVF